MKYTNLEHTMATHGNASGRPEDLVRLGYATQEDWDNAEPFEVSQESTQEKILKLESQQTARLLRNAALGDQYAVDELQRIEDEIAELR